MSASVENLLTVVPKFLPRPSFLRHSGSVGPSDLQETVNIIGCGAVGSHVALQAARMGWTKFRVWDADTVEDFNLPNQAYMPRHIGMYKVDALEELLQEFNPAVRVEKFKMFFTSEEHKTLLSGPLIIATDSIKSRRDIGDAFAFNSSVTDVIEARLGFDYAEIHHVDPTDFDSVKAFRNTLLTNDEDIPDGPCNLRICPTLVGAVANCMVGYLCLPYASQRTEGAPCVVPFMTRFLMRDALRTWVYPIPTTSA